MAGLRLLASTILAAFTCLCLWATQAVAIGGVGTYSADPSRFLRVISVSADSIEFVLSVGVAGADGDTECFEGDVSCLTISGSAKAGPGGLVYIDPGSGQQDHFLRRTSCSRHLGSGGKPWNRNGKSASSRRDRRALLSCCGIRIVKRSPSSADLLPNAFSQY